MSSLLEEKRRCLYICETSFIENLLELHRRFLFSLYQPLQYILFQIHHKLCCKRSLSYRYARKDISVNLPLGHTLLVALLCYVQPFSFSEAFCFAILTSRTKLSLALLVLWTWFIFVTIRLTSFHFFKHMLWGTYWVTYQEPFLTLLGNLFTHQLFPW